MAGCKAGLALISKVMTITPSTKIGTVIKNNPLAIDALILLSPHFSKLRNPILRKLLAPRVTIAEAAAIGDCTVEKLLEKLAFLGFEVKDAAISPIEEIDLADDVKIDLAMSYDARPELEAGLDPLNSILKKLPAIKAGQTMLVMNSFEPVPLIRILKARGYLITVSKKQPGLVCTYITKNNATESIAGPDAAPLSNEELFDNILQQYNLRFTEVDVRQMEMPKPMMTILDELEKLQSWEALYVRHRKIPVYLLPELKERNFNYVFKQMESEVIILIYPAYAYN
jgi:uncharacterized protein (DUF2249 family)